MKKILLTFIPLIIISFLSSLIIVSCKKEDVKKDNQIEEAILTDSAYEMSHQLENSNKERLRNAILELTELMKFIPSKHKALKEIYNLSDNKYYKDNFVFLSDLLNYDNSNLYKSKKIQSNYIGAFRDFIKETMVKKNADKYPNLNYYINRIFNKQYHPSKSNNLTDFYQNADIAFYIPYFEDDNDNLLSSNNPTYVPAVIDGNEGVGYKKVNNDWETVSVNDDYATNNLTMIIMPDESGGGGSSNNSSSVTTTYDGDCNALEPNSNNAWIRQVFIGHARINNKHQYDHLVSFTGNGAGSDIRIGRLASRERIPVDSTHNINASDWDTVCEITFTRKEIRKGIKKWIGAIWDPNWECRGEIHQQLFGVWEDDKTTKTIDFAGEIKWKGKELFSIKFDIPNHSKDEIIRQITREKTEFFATNLLDQGGGSWRGEYSFSDRSWAVYDSNTDFCYTMPHRWVFVGDNTRY